MLKVVGILKSIWYGFYFLNVFKCLLIGKELNKLWCSFLMKYFIVLKSMR